MVVEWLTFGALVVYAYLTYLIVKDIYNPLVSFNLQQRELSHLNFIMVNKSKVEVEVFGFLWSKTGDEFFEHDGGFYGNKTHWILQPFTQGFGHFNLKDLINKDKVKINNFLKDKSFSSIDFNMQIKYRKVGRKKWIRTSPQNFIYNFETGDFWLNV